MNSICLIAVLKKPIDDYYRFIEYKLPCFNKKGESSQQIVSTYWTEVPKSRLISIEEGTKISLHGHLDSHDKFGTILVIEQFTVLK